LAAEATCASSAPNLRDSPVRWPAATEALGDPCAQKARTGVASVYLPGGDPPDPPM
jgi:hypothetical protein